MHTVRGVAASHHAAHSRPVTGYAAAWRLYVDLALVASMRCPL